MNKVLDSEFNPWKNEYPALATEAESGNIVIADEIEASTYQLLGELKVQVGVSTAALNEG